jgi:hypothetical protein
MLIRIAHRAGCGTMTPSSFQMVIDLDLWS